MYDVGLFFIKTESLVTWHKVAVDTQLEDFRASSF